MMKNITVYILVISTFLFGCSTVKVADLPDSLAIPGHFISNKNAVSGTRPELRDFFNDEKLIRLIDTALRNNYDLKAAVQRIGIVRANVGIAQAARLPLVSGGVSAAVDKYGRYTLNGVGNFDTNLSPNIDKKRKIPNPTPDYFLGFRSSWELDIWGKLADRKKAAYSRLLASEKGRQWLTTQIISEVANLYYELVALDNQLSIIQKNIELQKRGLEVVEAQMAGGRATALAVRQFKAQVLHTQATEVNLRQSIIRIENELNALLGRYPVAVKRDSSIVKKTLPQDVAAGLPAEVLLRRPDIQQAELELLATKADVSAARKAFLPSLTLNPYIALNAFKAPLLFSAGSLVAGVAGSLTGPIINRKGIKGEFNIATAQQATAFYNYQQNIIRGFQEVVTQLQALKKLREAYDLKTAEVEELTQGVATANDLYLAGYANYLEVIVAQGSVLQSEMEQVDIKKAGFQTLINLYRSLGGSY